MADFKEITTQEQLDAIIGERLKRQAETLEKKYADYLSPDDFRTKTEGLNTQIATLSKSLEEAKAQPEELGKQIAGLQAQVKKYETDSVKNRIAAEQGLPYELANRLMGDTEDAIRADAIALKSHLNVSGAPLASSEPPSTTSKDAAYMELLTKLTTGGH